MAIAAARPSPGMSDASCTPARNGKNSRYSRSAVEPIRLSLVLDIMRLLQIVVAATIDSLCVDALSCDLRLSQFSSENRELLNCKLEYECSCGECGCHECGHEYSRVRV